MGFFADAYDLFIVGVAATLITTEWHIAGYQKSLLSSLALLTSAAGAVVFGRLADRVGRRKIYGFEVLVLAAGAAASACAPGIWWLIAFRGVLGFGIGGDYPVSATIMSECASRHDRGRMVALVFSMQAGGFAVLAVAFGGLWLIPGATTTLLPFLLLFGATYFFAKFGPNTTTFVYPAEIFPVRVRTTSHGIAAASGKLGAFLGTYALTALLPAIGLSRTSGIVAGVAVLGLLITVAFLPEHKGLSLEELTEAPLPSHARGEGAHVASLISQHLTAARPAVGHRRAARPPPAAAAPTCELDVHGREHGA